jgi:hypothetical protein
LAPRPRQQEVCGGYSARLGLRQRRRDPLRPLVRVRAFRLMAFGAAQLPGRWLSAPAALRELLVFTA